MLRTICIGWYLIAIFLLNCSNRVLIPPEATVDDGIHLESKFKVGKVVFPNDTIALKAVVSEGNKWRLLRFFEKCRDENSVKVGFIGGSITEGASASSIEKRFSTLLCVGLKILFKNTNIIEVNAGVGATNSRFGW
jgi:hypothetical protein